MNTLGLSNKLKKQGVKLGLSIKEGLIADRYQISYLIIALGILLCYLPIRTLMTDQSAWSFAMTSPFTFNMLLFMGFWGYWTEQWFKKKPKTSNNKILKYAVDLGGLFIIILIYRFVGGINTVFG